MTITELTTAYLLPKIPNFQYYKVMNFFSITDLHTKEKQSFGYLEDDRFIRIPKISQELLANLVNVEFDINKVRMEPVPDLSKPIKLKNQPKDDIQRDVINNVLNEFNKGEERVVISLPTGRGKTYVATNIISQLNKAAFIFVKSDELRKQWYKSFQTHTWSKNVVIANGSGDLLTILENSDDVKYDAIITTHRTVQSFIDKYNIRNFNKLLMGQNIGIKVFDEFDLETDSTFKIETYTCVEKTLYLSATDYKSPNCNKIFQSVYGIIPNYGKDYDFGTKRNAIMVLYNSKPSRSLYTKCFRYTRDGFQMDYHKYHAYVVEQKSYEAGLKMIWDKLISTRYYNKDNYYKTVFFIGRKVTAEKFRKDLATLFGISPNAISILNSDTPKDLRGPAFDYKLIISTASSLGRGIDIKDLDIIIDLETRASISGSTQVIGRVSRAGAKGIGTYVSFVDTAFPTVLRNYQRKVDIGFYDKEFTNIKVVDITKK